MNLACFDEVYAIPSDLAIRTSLRTQQILAHETGVADVVDPLGGSYYVEALTTEMEEKFKAILESLDKKGGIVKEIETGNIQRELAQQKYQIQKKVNSGERVLVGVNRFQVKEEEKDLEIYKIAPEIVKRQIERFKRVKQSRDPVKGCGVSGKAERGRQGGRESDAPPVRALESERHVGGNCGGPERSLRRVPGTEYGVIRGEEKMDKKQRIRVLIAKIGLDGHDVGQKY